MNYHAYVINLQHATDRWRHMQDQLDKIAIPYTRINATYGDKIIHPIPNYAQDKYRMYVGKETNMREIGCYLSHLDALQNFINSDHDFALILEDDIHLPNFLPSLLEKSISHYLDWDLLRLTSSRSGNHLKIRTLTDSYSLTYTTDVVKNTGAYMINRMAAKLCIDKLSLIYLPYDVALDRDWFIGFRAACIFPYPIALENFPTQIPKAKRIYPYRMTTFRLFHLISRFRRQFHRRKCYRLSQKRNIRLQC